MARTIQAVFESGVLRPLEPLPFAEHQEVTITLSDQGEPPLLSDDELKARFNLLASQWKVARGFSSSVNAWARLPAYRAIIALGSPVVPLLLQELEKVPDHWFWALKELTKENPVTPDCRGNVAEMARCWINWGKDERWSGGDVKTKA